MNIYKIVFANNEIVNCQVSNQRFDHDSEYCYEYMGQIKYAMVKSDSEDGAKATAKKLIQNSRNNNRINPYISAAA